MKKMFVCRVLFLGLVLGLSSIAGAADHKQLKAFPAAGEGQERFVIVLPHKERGEENSFKVELVVGKVMETDGVNRVGLGAQIEEKPLEGWGYTFYVVEKVGPAMSTLIGVPPGTPKVTRFVGGQPLQIRYNSRLPIVVYVPVGCEVKYRIWSVGEHYEAAEKG